MVKKTVAFVMILFIILGNNIVTTIAASPFSCPICGNKNMYITKVYRDVTCTTDGLYYYSCSCFNYEFFEPIPYTVPALGHRYVSYNLKPTCIYSGLMGGLYCTRCADIKQEPVVVPPCHTYTRVEQLTCNEYTCEVCGDSYSKDKISGDINNDEYLSISDVSHIQKLVSGLVEETEFNIIADVDGNGDIALRDATYIQLYLAKLIEVLPITQ